jgi:DNA polymerase-3 subunit alpha
METAPHDGIPPGDTEALAFLRTDCTGGAPWLSEQRVRAVLRSLEVSCFDELVAAMAMAQPGTQNFLPLYLNRREGRCSDALIHPIVDSIASDTYGVPLFQEQIVQAIREMSGFDSDRADRMRRHAGRILTPEIESEMEAFRIESQRRHPDLRRNAIQKVQGGLTLYAPYTYPRRRAIKKAMIAYVAAYRKVHDGLD